MARRCHWIVGIVLAAVLAPSLALAQQTPLLPTVPIGPGVPDLNAPADRALPENEAKRPQVKLDVTVSPNTGVPRIETPGEPAPPAIAELALLSSEYVDPRYICNSRCPDDPGPWERICTTYGDQIHRSVDDFRNFYCTEDLLYVGVAVGVAAPFANTKFDRNARDWYQQQAGTSQGANDTANFFKNFGAWQYAVPAYLACSFTGHLFPDTPAFATVGNFGNRGMRALIVGAPMVGILQVGLGSDRPYTGNSQWQPFRSNHGASGHAFVGAIPFLTAASMTDSRPLQVLLFAGSMATGWSRIQHDDHYFSQVLLGWSIAYLAVHAVNQTEGDHSRVRIVPFDVPKGIGMGVQVDF